MHQGLSKKLMLAAASVVALVSGGVARAQTSEPVAATDTRVRFDIPAQSLDQALMEYSRQAHVAIVAPTTLVSGRTSGAVVGEFAPDHALTRLLEGSGLRVDRGASGGFVLVEDQPSPTQLGAASGPASSARSAELTGGVRDVNTGAALRGALVRIEETGQTTSTNDAGEFRFPGVTPGEYTLRISYLGYRETTRRVRIGANARVRETFELVGGSDEEALIVYGQRSSRAQALNQERTGANSRTIIEGDFLGQFDGATISESLRRAPGVAFQPDPVTGDGVNIIVRGLAPEYNTVTLNGQRLAVGSGVDRSASLNNMLTESISRVTINKTLLPSQDSSGTGALVEIETRGPLDRPTRFMSLGIEGDVWQDDFADDQIYSGTVSGRFGPSDNFGLSASLQYRDRDLSQVSYGIDTLTYGRYLPAGVSSLADIDPRTLFPFEDGVDDAFPRAVSTSQDRVLYENLSLTLSAEWRPNPNTNLRVDYARAEQTGDQYVRGTSVGTLFENAPLPIDELGGEIRTAPVWEGAFGFNPFGVSQFYVLSRDQEDTTETLTFQGVTDVNQWSFDYRFGYSAAERLRPSEYRLSALGAANFNDSFFVDDLNLAYVAPGAFENTIDGRIVSLYPSRSGDAYPLPLLTDAGFALYNDPDNYHFYRGSSITGTRGENERWSTGLDITRNIESDWLRYIKGGAFYEVSTSSNNQNWRRREITRLGDAPSPLFGLTVPWSLLGFSLSENNLAAIGQNGGFNVVPIDQLIAFADSIDELSQGPDAIFSVVDIPMDPRRDQQETTERNFAAYLETRAEFGRLELIGGLRVEQTRVESITLNGPRIYDENFVEDVAFTLANDRLITLRGDQTDLLPRILANYRFSDDVILRAGYYTTVARPALNQLNQNDRLIGLYLAPFFGPDGNQPMLSIVEANPDLEPAVTHNLDVALEFYDGDIGAIKLAAFLKRTDNFLDYAFVRGTDALDGVILPADPRFENLPDNIYIEASRPVNSGDSAETWGVELSAERRLDFLPGFWSDFGILANLTYNDSSRTQSWPYSGSPTGSVELSGPYSSQPRWSGTIALTYTAHGLDASLSYSEQDRYLTSLGANGLHSYQDELNSLNFRAAYENQALGSTWRLSLEGVDLLRDPEEPSTATSSGGEDGVPRIATHGYFNGGRSVRLGLSTTF